MEALTTLNFQPDHSRQWNSIIKRQAKLKNDNAILKAYTQMESLSILPDNTTLPLILKACGKLQAVERGRKIHGDINGTHLINDVRVGTALIDFYCKCGSFEDALHAFDRIPEKDVVSWNEMISGSVDCREYEVALCLVKEMQRENLRPNSRTAVSLLIASRELSDFRLGMGIHGYCLRNGLLDRNAHIATSLIGFYSRFDVEVAYRVLESLDSRCIASWNAMISGFLDNGDYMDVLKKFSAMLKKGLNYDPVTILVVIQACGELGSVELGMQVHQLAVKCGYDKDLNVVNALINMYSKMGYTKTSYVLFQSSSTKDTALWNSIISAYVERGCTEEAVKLINKMQVEDISIDERTIVIMLPLCLSFANGLRFGNSLHGQVIKLGVENNMYTINALLSMYGELNCVEDALRIFSKTKNLDVMSWNIMISALAHNELGNQAFKLFCQMHETDVKPNSHTIISVLTTCNNDSFLCVGRSIHGYAIKQCLDSDPQVNTAITEMYMQCSDEATAMNLFESFGNKDVVSWNAMIANYVNCGEPIKALMIFHHMVIQVEPNLATIINVLNSCTHLVHLPQGKCIHAYAMRRASSLGFDLSMANAFISMYARCGCMQYAEKIFKALPKKNIVSWNAMIAGYGMHGRGQDAMLVYSQMLENGFSPTGVTFVSALSACSHSGLVKDGLQLYHSMVNEFGMIPELVHYSCVVDLLARGGLLDEAWNFINSMSISPDASGLLRSFLKKGLLNLADKVTEALNWSGVRGNRETYNILLDYYVCAGRLNDTWSIIAKMRSEGYQLNSYVYSKVIELYRDNGMWKKALAIVGEIQEMGLQLDKRIYNSIIDTFGKYGELGEALEVFKKMQQEAIEPDIRTWNLLIGWHCKYGKLDKAIDLFNRMLEQGLYPDPKIFVIIITRLGEQGRWDVIKKNFENLQCLGHHKSGAIYAILANIYGQYGKYQDPEDCINALKSAGLQLSPSLFCLLANAYAQQGLCEQTVKVLQIMESDGMEPNLIMLNVLINAFGTAGRHMEALSIYHHMKEIGISPDVVTYSTIMKALMRARKFDQVPKIYGEMESSGCTPDRKARELLKAATMVLNQRCY